MGFRPTTPHKDAGWRIDPPVSEPSEQIASSAATEAAEPPLDPPGTRSRSQGLRVIWRNFPWRSPWRIRQDLPDQKTEPQPRAICV